MSSHRVPGRSRLTVVGAAAVVGALAVTMLILMWPHPANGSAAAPKPASIVPGMPSTGHASPAAISSADASKEAALVADEDTRLTDVRTITALARWQNKDWKTPYRLSSDSGYTLVLTPNSTPYTLDTLLQLAPQTLLRLSDGSVLLEENIAVMPDATLQLDQPNGLTLHLASSASGFVSIVSFGGDISLQGSAGHPLVLNGWDAQAGRTDTDTTDGRAYIRAIGGQFSIDHATISDLGFWSGRTGGIALTGTNRPDVGAIQRSTKDDDTNVPMISGTNGGEKILPTGKLPKGAAPPKMDFSVPELSYVSASITNTTVTDDAYGLFASGVNGLQISASSFSQNQITGVQLHRYVSSGAIANSTANQNGGDGFDLERATEGITITGSTATGNANNGFTLSGRPLADGPSAVGSPTTSYGNNSLSGSTAENNGHYGISVLGGLNIAVTNNRVSNSDMGIVVADATDTISITANQVSGSNRHGLALLDGVKGATVTGNTINGGAGAIYLRNAQGTVRGNTVESGTEHGIEVIGKTDKSTAIADNEVAGNGPSALDTARADGSLTMSNNHSSGWHDTTPWYARLKSLLHPMTLLWATILVLVLLTAIRGRRQKVTGIGPAHPYAHQMEHRRLIDGGLATPDEQVATPPADGNGHRPNDELVGV
jgi:parallel beta-helix repeat protein